jgi:hypothetical protein
MEQPMKAILAQRYFFGRGTRATDDYDQFWIRYKPGRVVRKNLKTWMKFEKWVNLLLAIVLVYSFLMHGTAMAFTILGVICFCYLATRAQNFLYPTHIALDKEGLQLHWMHSWCTFSSAVIGWDRLSHVTITKEKHILLGTKVPALEFNVIARGMDSRQRLPFRLLGPGIASGWFFADRGKLSLKLDGIASSDDRKRLQLALKKFLPSYRIEPIVSDELNLSLKVESYTDLWMDALTSSVKRVREDPLPAGARILKGRFEITREIGAGGQAIVYEAVDNTPPLAMGTDPRKVVLKEFVLPAHAGIKVRRRVLENIQKEAELLQGLKHPNIVKMIEFFVEDQRAYLALEHITGPTIKDCVIRKGALTEREAVFFAMQMCEILAYLHAQSPPILHRDFTPDNLMIAHGDILKLIDFNVAQRLENDSIKTVVGKHSYIPPEQFRGRPCPQSDIYALGATMYFMLTANEPEAISRLDPREANQSLSREISDIVATATAIELTDRFANVNLVMTELQRIKQDRYND